MPSLVQRNLTIQGGLTFQFTLEGVRNPTPGATYAYTLQSPDGRVLLGDGTAFPYAPFLASGWNRTTRVLSGTAPTDGVSWTLLYTATAPGELYWTEFTIVQTLVPATAIEPVLALVNWRDQQRWVQDLGHERVLLYSLPQYAPAGSGFEMAGEQWLPVEGMLEFQPPSAESDTRDILIEDEANRFDYTDDEGEIISAGAYTVTAQIQTRLKMARGGMRLAWHEAYACHGGPYGLRNLAYNRISPPRWIYYDRGNSRAPGGFGPRLHFPGNRQPKVIGTWNAFISRFQERVTPGGIFVDLVLTPETNFQQYREVPTPSNTLWTQPATVLNAPSIDWTA